MKSPAEILGCNASTHLRKYGVWSLLSMRLEKSYGIWSREFSHDYTPFESGLDQFIDFSKPKFIGRDAVLKLRDESPKRKLVTLTVDATDIDANGPERPFETLIEFAAVEAGVVDLIRDRYTANGLSIRR